MPDSRIARKIARIMDKLSDRGLINKTGDSGGKVEYSFVPSRKLSKIIDKLSALGVVAGIDNREGRVEFSIGNFRGTFPKMEKESVAERIKRIIRRERKKITGFIPHLTSYLAVNAGIFFIYLMTSFLKHPWFLYVAGGWGIGLVAHFISVLTAKKTIGIMNGLPSGTTEKQLKILEKKLKNEEGFVSHLGSFISVNAFLIMIYMMTTPFGYPWFIFPLAGWGIGFFFHAAGAFAKNREYAARLKEGGFDFNAVGTFSQETSGVEKNVMDEYKKNGTKSSRSGNGSLLDEAVKIKKSIIEKIKSDEGLKSKFDSDIGELLDSYTEQIGKLVERDKELASALNLITVDENESRLNELREKRESSSNEELKKHYDKSIKQHEDQKKSYEELLNQKEIIHLRITQAVMSLKQLNLDMLKMKEVIKNNEISTSIESVELRTKELGKYVNNLKQSYRELEREI